MELIALVKKIDELKEIMAACNVNHIAINGFYKQDDKGNIDAKFTTDICQDERANNEKPNYARYYGGR